MMARLMLMDTLDAKVAGFYGSDCSLRISLRSRKTKKAFLHGYRFPVPALFECTVRQVDSYYYSQNSVDERDQRIKAL